MDEAAWLGSRNTEAMLDWFRTRGPLTDRKLRLFMCACCRLGEPALSSDQVLPPPQGFLAPIKKLGRWLENRHVLENRRVLRAYERFADGLATDEDIKAMAPDWEFSWDPLLELARAHGDAAEEVVADFLALARECYEQQPEGQAELLRHIVGNPFRPLASPAHWPHTVTTLADAMYNGDNVSFALHDALLDGGYTALAEHFREAYHPKGCAWLDAILKNQ